MATKGEEEDVEGLRLKITALLASKQASLQSVANAIGKRTRTLQSWILNTDPNRSTHDDWNIHNRLLDVLLIHSSSQQSPPPPPPSPSPQTSSKSLSILLQFPSCKSISPLIVTFPQDDTRFR